MNAYELADGGEHIAQTNYSLDNQIRGYLMDMAIMLRQQADRIAELEKECNWAKDQWNRDRICFEAHKQELEKDLALKTRDRDVFRDFTLAYEKRITELEKDYTTACLEVRDLCRENEKLKDKKENTSATYVKALKDRIADLEGIEKAWIRAFAEKERQRADRNEQ